MCLVLATLGFELEYFIMGMIGNELLLHSYNSSHVNLEKLLSCLMFHSIFGSCFPFLIMSTWVDYEKVIMFIIMHHKVKIFR